LIFDRLAPHTGDGFIWVWLDFSHGTLALTFPPRFSASEWDCREFGETEYHVLACARKAPPGAAAIAPRRE
jgi:hypothetical protein